MVWHYLHTSVAQNWLVCPEPQEAGVLLPRYNAVTSQSDDLPHTCGERSRTQASGVVLCVSSYVADLSLHHVCCPVDAHSGTFHHQPLTFCLQGGVVGGGVTALLSLNFSCNEISCVCSVCGLYLVYVGACMHECEGQRSASCVIYCVF